MKPCHVVGFSLWCITLLRICALLLSAGLPSPTDAWCLAPAWPHPMPRQGRIWQGMGIPGKVWMDPGLGRGSPSLATTTLAGAQGWEGTWHWYWVCPSFIQSFFWMNPVRVRSSPSSTWSFPTYLPKIAPCCCSKFRVGAPKCSPPPPPKYFSGFKTQICASSAAGTTFALMTKVLVKPLLWTKQPEKSLS